MTSYKIIKTITNNLVRAKDINDKDVILTGNGIGFKKTRNDIIPSSTVEAVFELRDEHESLLYDQLVNNTSPRLIEVSNTVILYIQSSFKKSLNEHIHISLTDHICFLVRRYKMGIPITNPFDYETDILYPKETAVARHAVSILNDQLHIDIPDGEAAFITLHIISALSDDTISSIQQTTILVNRLISILEQHLEMPLDHTDLNYARLATHLRFMIERVERNEVIKIPEEMTLTIKNNYHVCYTLAWKLVKIVQQEMKREIDESEVICLSLHLYRFENNKV